MKKKRIGKVFASWILIICLVIPLCSGFTIQATAAGNHLSITELKCESAVNPLGIDQKTPKFSWKLISDQRGVMQKSYQLMVSSSKEKLEAGNYDIWDSGVRETDQSIEILYEGQPLEPKTRYFWKVQVIDNKGNSSRSTEEAYWETGLMETDWDAKWIQLDKDAMPNPQKYSIEMDFRIIKDDAGIIFAGKDTSNFLMWQINTFEDKQNHLTRFRPHQWVDNQAKCIKEVEIDHIIPKDKQKDQYRIKIEVDGNQITTWIGDEQIDQMTSEYAAYGKIGFRQMYAPGDCDEQAAFDNIIIRDGDGNIMFSDDFSKEENTNFDFGTIEKGELVVVNKLDLQKDGISGAPIYRKEFTEDRKVKKATVYSSALGIYELEINGQKVGNDLFNPGWTNYELNQDDNNYVMYQTFDVTNMINKGKNVIGAITGHGWYSGKLFVGGKERYGKGSKLLCQLELEFENGEKTVIGTDSTWLISKDGPIIEDDFQMGETYDSRREIAGWSTSDASLEGTSWGNAKESSYEGDIVAQMGPTVKETQEIKPIEVTQPSKGTYIFNLGQNISGYARLQVKGEAGTKVKLRFGEMLKSDGTLYTENLRSAAATDYYILKGTGETETWKPKFTFHGYQYIEVTGYPGEPTADDITGIAISSLQNQTGTFETSNEDVNKLQSNITWGQKDNFISVPTDCPQRDERLGYTGDSQVFVRTAAMNQDVKEFFKKFMKDVTTNQRENGAIADWSPNYVTEGDGLSGSFGAAGWGDGIITIPWTMYTTYGDTSSITDNYQAMKKWISYYQSLEKENHVIINKVGNDYGDWLSVNSDTPRNVVNTGYYAYSTNLLSKMAAVIGETEDAKYYEQLFQDIKAGFNEDFVDEEGRISGNTQTCYVFALKFDLLNTEADRKRAAEYLVEDIKSRDWHLTTGFLGVSYLCPILSEMGYSDVAYRLLLQDTYPSWLYSVRSGATTIWERWNSYNKEEDIFESTGMNSFNHYSLGSVGEWFYQYAAGITYDSEKPGFKHFEVNPYPGGGLEFVNSSYDSVYGTITSNWNYRDGNTFELQVSVPANTTALISIPAESKEGVMENGTSAIQSPDLKFVEMKDGKAVFEAGSGNYSFTSESKQQYLLNVVDENPSQPHVISINGEIPRRLPIIETVNYGDKITLLAAPINDVDYTFSQWSGDVEGTNKEIKLQIDKSYKIAVSSQFTDIKNMAIGKQVNASTSITNPDWKASNLTDGKLTSVAGSLGFSSNEIKGATVNEWVEIDLEKDTRLSRIKLYPRTDVVTADGKTPSFPKNLSIQVCRAGESKYETLISFTDYEAPFGKPALIELKEPVIASKVRVHVSKVGEPPKGEVIYFQLAEMGIYDQTVINYEELDAALLKAQDYEGKEKDFTSDSWKVFSGKWQSAKDIKNDATVLQNKVNIVAQELMNAIKGLKLEKDTQSPTMPENLKVSNITETSAVITWNPSLDNVGVEKYLVKNNKAILAEVTEGTTASIKALTAGTSYIFEIVALDKEGNVSLPATVSFKTIEKPKEPVPKPEPEIRVSSVKLDKDKMTIKGTGSAQLKAVVYPENAKNKNISWVSSDKAVATVDKNGKIAAKKQGTAVITVITSDGGKKAVCKVEVTEVKASKLTLNVRKKTVDKGKSYKMKAAIKPSNTTDKVTWISSSKKVASVSSNGTISAKKAGTTVITAKVRKGLQISCTITVREVKSTGIKLSVKKKTLKKGTELQLKATITPKNSTDSVTWKSSNPKVVKISSKGKMTALKKGSSKITVKTTSGKKAECKITVK